MRRAIISPAVLAGAALDELKAWLAITTAGDDQALTALLHAALELCEAFTGQMPLEATCEEVLPACRQWQDLQTRPVKAITGIEGILADGSRVALAAGDSMLDLTADGGGRVAILRPGDAPLFAVRFTAGMAGDWTALPDSLRQGVLRLAAYQYRERDQGALQAVPPAAVAALWRPWRRMRLA